MKPTAAILVVAGFSIALSMSVHSEWRESPPVSTLTLYQDVLPQPQWQAVEPLSAPASPGTHNGSVPHAAPSQSDAANLDAEQMMQAARLAHQQGDKQLWLAHLREAAQRDSAEAHYELARAYSEGTVVQADADAVTRHLQASARLGNPEALRVQGWRKIRGIGGAADLEEGIAYLSQAALLSVRAQRELGMLLAGLLDVDATDAPLGEQFLHHAASSGDMESQYQLGRYLMLNLREIESLQWLDLAHQQGHSEAGKLLNDLGGVTDRPSVPANASGQAWFDAANRIMLQPVKPLAGVLGIFRPKTTKCSGGHAVRGLQRGITFLALHIASHNKSIT